MTWKIIPIDNPGNDFQYGGDDTKKINKFLSGYDLTLESTSDKVEVDTPTSYRTDKLRIKSPSTGFNYIFRSQNITADRIISLPLMTGDGEISLAASNAINDWGINLQTFRHQNIKFMNPLATFGYLLNTSAITSNTNVILPPLSSDDTFVFANATQTLTNKTLTAPVISSMTINTDSNTIKHSTTNNAGDLMVNTGSKFDRLARGAANQLPIINPTGTGLTWIDKSSLAGSGGGGGGTVTGDHLIPIVGNVITGAWYATTTAGGTGCWHNLLTNTSNVSPQPIPDTTGRMGLIYNFTSDDHRGGFKTNTVHFSRQNNPELWVRYKLTLGASDDDYRVAIGFISDMSASFDSDSELDNKSAFMWFKETADAVIQVGLNDGDSAHNKDATVSLTSTDVGIHTIRLFGDSVNNRWGISLDGANATYFTAEAPAHTTKLGSIVQFENEDSSSRSVELFGAYFKCTVV